MPNSDEQGIVDDIMNIKPLFQLTDLISAMNMKRSDITPSVVMSHRVRWCLSADWFTEPADQRMLTVITTVPGSLLGTSSLDRVFESALRRTCISSSTIRSVYMSLRHRAG